MSYKQKRKNSQQIQFKRLFLKYALKKKTDYVFSYTKIKIADLKKINFQEIATLKYKADVPLPFHYGINLDVFLFFCLTVRLNVQTLILVKLS